MDHPHDRLEPTFIARLIDERRKERGLSIRSAAEESSISEGRWRQIAKGYQQMSGGVRAPVNAPPETLARMAAAVRFEASNLERQLSEAGGLDELAQKVIRRMQLAEAARNYRGSVFGFGLDTPEHLLEIEKWISALQDRVESLEDEVEDLRKLALESGAQSRGVRTEATAAVDEEVGSEDVPESKDEVALAARRGTPDHLPDTDYDNWGA